MTERKNLVASIHQRLLNRARNSDRTFQEIFQAYAIERFLFRLARSRYAEKFVLKGALLLTAWGLPLSRPTRDIDLLGYTSNALGTLEKIVQDVCDQAVEADGMVYDIQSIEAERIKEDADYEGVRIRFFGYLGSARVRMQIDVGFADVISPNSILLDYPTLLDMPVPHLRGYSRESVIAEKLQAMVYLDTLNSRMKDFYDLWVLANKFDFDGGALQNAIRLTFMHRQTAIPAGPVRSFSEAFAAEKQAMWAAFLTRNRIQNIPGNLDAVTRDLDAFFSQVLIAITNGEEFRSSWRSATGWTV